MNSIAWADWLGYGESRYDRLMAFGGLADVKEAVRRSQEWMIGMYSQSTLVRFGGKTVSPRFIPDFSTEISRSVGPS
jgi:hypothetical protein